MSTARVADNGGARRVAAQGRACSPAELAFLIGVPLLGCSAPLPPRRGGHGALLPGAAGQGHSLDGCSHRDDALHSLVRRRVYLLLRGLEGTAAQISRIALVPFVVFYSAWEALQGIGVGILVDEVNDLPQAERATGADLVPDFADNILIRNFGVFGNIGSLSLIIAMIAAGVALRRHAGAPFAVAALLGVSGFLVTAHPPPFGPTGLALFIVAVLLFVRGGRPSIQPAW